MAYRWSGIPSTTETIEADDLMEGIARTELFINQGIGERSFRDPDPVTVPTGRPNHDNDGYIEKKHIFKPDFYASPSPRMEAVSSQVHYRTTGHSHSEGVIFTPTNAGAGWSAIPGTATRIKLRDYARMYFMASFYCFEFGGVSYTKGWSGDVDSGESRYKHDLWGGETRRAGTVALAVHGATDIPYSHFGSTERLIYSSTLFPFTPARSNQVELEAYGFPLLNMIGRHQHNIAYTQDFSPGVYDVGLVFSARVASDTKSFAAAFNETAKEVLDGGDIRLSKTVFFMARTMVCDVQYNQRADASYELDEWRTSNSNDPQAI